jgi:hypothetical protein
MEFASEMVIRASKENLKIAEFPIEYHPRGGESKLSSFRDGWRHLRFLLLFCPHWLFFVPGLGLGAAGLVIGGIMAAQPITTRDVMFDVDTLVVASALVVSGVQSVLFWICAHVYASSEGFLPNEPYVQRVLAKLSLERGIALGSIIGMAGLVGLVSSLTNWQGARFGQVNFEHALRLIVPSATALVVSSQLILGTFFLSLLGIKQTRHAQIAVETHTQITVEAKIKVSDEPVTAPVL